MTSFHQFALYSSLLAGSIGSVLIAFSCWRLSEMAKGNLLIAARVASITFLLINGFYCFASLVVQLPMGLNEWVLKLYELEGIWETSAHLFYISLSVVFLSLARWFYLRLPGPPTTDRDDPPGDAFHPGR